MRLTSVLYGRKEKERERERKNTHELQKTDIEDGKPVVDAKWGARFGSKKLSHLGYLIHHDSTVSLLK